jgi:hypothetical protein
LVFYLTAAGRTVLGEPPPNVAKGESPNSREARTATKAKPKANWQENLPEFNVSGKAAGIAVAAIVVALGIVFFNNRTPATFKDRGEEIGRLFVANDLARLKTLATPDSVDELVQWYGITNGIFQDRKKLWSGRPIQLSALVIDETPKARSGEMVISLVPAGGSNNNEPVARGKEVAALALRSLELTVFFTADAWGKWRIDGKRTLNAAPRVPR